MTWQCRSEEQVYPLVIARLCQSGEAIPRQDGTNCFAWLRITRSEAQAFNREWLDMLLAQEPLI